DLSRIVAAVFVVDVLDGLFALIRLDVDVDIGWAVADRRQEPLEQQLIGHRIDRGDAKGITDRRMGRRSPPLTQDVVLRTEPGVVVVHQEVSWKLELGNYFQLTLDLGI